MLSTSISTRPTRYRPPTFTWGRRQSRKVRVMSPAAMSSRSSLLNSTGVDPTTSGAQHRQTLTRSILRSIAAGEQPGAWRAPEDRVATGPGLVDDDCRGGSEFSAGLQDQIVLQTVEGEFHVEPIGQDAGHRLVVSVAVHPRVIHTRPERFHFTSS